MVAFIVFSIIFLLVLFIIFVCYRNFTIRGRYPNVVFVSKEQYGYKYALSVSSGGSLDIPIFRYGEKINTLSVLYNPNHRKMFQDAHNKANDYIKEKTDTIKSVDEVIAFGKKHKKLGKVFSVTKNLGI